VCVCVCVCVYSMRRLLQQHDGYSEQSSALRDRLPPQHQLYLPHRGRSQPSDGPQVRRRWRVNIKMYFRNNSSIRKKGEISTFFSRSHFFQFDEILLFKP